MKLETAHRDNLGSFVIVTTPEPHEGKVRFRTTVLMRGTRPGFLFESYTSDQHRAQDQHMAAKCRAAGSFLQDWLRAVHGTPDAKPTAEVDRALGWLTLPEHDGEMLLANTLEQHLATLERTTRERMAHYGFPIVD